MRPMRYASGRPVRPEHRVFAFISSALSCLCLCAPAAAQYEVTDSGESIKISTPELEAVIRRKGYVSGVAAQGFLDKKTGAVKNDRRIRGALPTIEKLLDAGASVIAMSHLGRPEKATPEERKNLTMDRVAAKFA